MEHDRETIEQIRRHIDKINTVYDEKFERARMCFDFTGDEINVYLDNGIYTVNVFIGKPSDANKFLSFHRNCISALEHLF